jgi:hypothetical protein
MENPRVKFRVVGEGEADDLSRAALALSESAREYTAYAAQVLRRAMENLATAELDMSNPAPLEAIFSMSHDFRGTGRLFGYDLLTVIGDSLCNYLRDRAAYPNKNMNVVRVHLAALNFVLENQIRGLGGDAGKRLIAKLDALRSD